MVASSDNDEQPATVEVSLANKLLTSLPPSVFQNAIQISSLSLERNRLVTLPDKFGAFLSLQTLNLSYNPLGCIPEVVCELLQLKKLVMISCAIESLPYSMENLFSLQHLILDLNSIRKSEDVLHKLSSLEVLSLGMNKVTYFSSLLPENLTKLNLDNNYLHYFPDEVLSLHSLVHLNLSFNRIADLPNDIGVLSNLETLLLVNNRLTALPSSITDLNQLRLLDVSHNQVGVLPGQLSRMGALEELLLDNNPLIQPPRHICQHGVDAIRAFQDCLQKQIYEPCARTIRIFLLGSSRSGKQDIFAFLTGKSKDEITKGKALQLEKNDLKGISVDVWKCSGKPRFKLVHQLLFSKNCLFILCVNVDTYQSYTFKEHVTDWIELVHVAVPTALILVIPTYKPKGSRPSLAKKQTEKNIKSLFKAINSWLANTEDSLRTKLKELVILQSSSRSIWVKEKMDVIQDLLLFRPTILPEVPGKHLSWKLGKVSKCSLALQSYLEQLTHNDCMFHGLRDEVQSSWRTLEKLVVNYRRKPGRLFLDKSNVQDPAVQIGVHPGQVQDSLDFLENCGTIFIFQRMLHMRLRLFHSPKVLVEILNAVLRERLFDNRKSMVLEDFTPFEAQEEEESISKEGIMSHAFLTSLLRHHKPTADVDVQHVAALLRNLSVARQVDTGSRIDQKSSPARSDSKLRAANRNAHRNSSCNNIRVSYSEMPPKIMNPKSFRIPWYLRRDYSETQPEKLAALWPKYLNLDTHQLQVNCIFRNCSHLNSIFDRLSISVHHCLDYRDDWVGGFLATIDRVPLLVQSNTFESRPCISIATRGELSMYTSMWKVIFQIAKCLLQLLAEYPGLYYDFMIVCPHCLKLHDISKLDGAHKFYWEEMILTLDPTELDKITCPFLKTSQTFPRCLTHPPIVELDDRYADHFSRVAPYLSRANWRNFGRALGLKDYLIDYVRDATPDFDFVQQKVNMLILWHRLFMLYSSVDDLVEACRKTGLDFLADELTASHVISRAPSLIVRPSLTNQESFAVFENSESNDSSQSTDGS